MERQGRYAQTQRSCDGFPVIATGRTEAVSLSFLTSATLGAISGSIEQFSDPRDGCSWMLRILSLVTGHIHWQNAPVWEGSCTLPAAPPSSYPANNRSPLSAGSVV